jgi:hypothetical protein
MTSGLQNLETLDDPSDVGERCARVRRELPAERVLPDLAPAVRGPGAYRCPLHEDRDPSFRLFPGEKGWYCFGCRRGGGALEFVMASRGLDLEGALAFLEERYPLGPRVGPPSSAEFREVLVLADTISRQTSDRAGPRSRRKTCEPPADVLARIERCYDYRDERGELRYQAVRLRDPKEFRQRRPDGDGGWIWNLDGVRKLLYRLPDLLAAPRARVWVTEGEKDADRLASLGLCATTAGGAEHWQHVDLRPLRRRPVVLLPDNDAVGLTSAVRLANTLLATAESVRVLRLPHLPPKGDVSDWLDGGGDAGRLRGLADGASPWMPEEFRPCRD